MEAANIASKNRVPALSTKLSSLHHNNLRRPMPNTPLQNSKNPERQEVFALVRAATDSIFARQNTGSARLPPSRPVVRGSPDPAPARLLAALPRLPELAA